MNWIIYLALSKTKFDFVQLTLEDTDHSEEIFESLNATGKKLTNFDYLRNNLFLRARKLGNDENEKPYSEIFYEKYWKFEQDGPYHWEADNLEEFLQKFLLHTLGSDCLSVGNVNPLDVYREYSRKAGGIENEFKDLLSYAKSYLSLENDEDT